MQKNLLEKRIAILYNMQWNGQKPRWAYDLIPAIPVIGNSINKMPKRILSYASCENIPEVYARHLCGLKKEEQIHRGRLKGNDKKYNTFRFSHITPFNKGDQFVITWFVIKFVLENEIDCFSRVATVFAEEIAVANPVKFTISRNESQNNKDPNSDFCFIDSKPYIINDLKVIKPDIIIIPKTRFNKISKYCNWNDIILRSEIKRDVTFVKIHQVGWPTNSFKSEPNDINTDLARITSWIENTRYKKNMKSHLQWLKNKYIKERNEWIQVISNS